MFLNHNLPSTLSAFDISPYSHPLTAMETFDNIHLDLSKQPGRCRLAESGLGWKPTGGSEPFTLDSTQMSSAQWSRASKGYEIKIFTKDNQVIQLDGFQEEVC